MRRAVVTVLAVGLVTAGLTSCGSGGEAAGSTAGAGSSGSASSSPSGAITVFAAASLTEAFDRIGTQFEALHPGVRVSFSYAASSALATQITAGAPADVFASASPTDMGQVVTAGEASTPSTFASNTMEIAVPPSNPAHVTSVADLVKRSVKVAVCQPQVPCGATAAKVFANAGVTVRPVTLEPDVKSVLSKVELGEVDAGIVYVTDVQAAGARVAGVPIPADVNASTGYPIAALTGSRNAATAAAFVAFVLSPAGRGVLADSGFAQP